MFDKKKGLLILLLFIVSICAISSVSAADNSMDFVAEDIASDTVISEEASDAVTLDESNADDVAANVDEDLEKTLGSSN